MLRAWLHEGMDKSGPVAQMLWPLSFGLLLLRKKGLRSLMPLYSRFLFCVLYFVICIFGLLVWGGVG